jgi:Flp pilus assembly pilin Flp
MDRRDFRNWMRGLSRCERGAAVVEYAVLLGAVALALSSAIGAMGGEVRGSLESIATALQLHAARL